MNSYDVQYMKNVAYVQAQTAAALIEMEGMKAENQDRLSKGLTIAYDAEAFNRLIEYYGISHNQVLTTFNNGV